MKKRILACILIVCLICSLSGCVYSHNYDKNGNELSEAEVKEKINSIKESITPRIKDALPDKEKIKSHYLN